MTEGLEAGLITSSVGAEGDVSFCSLPEVAAAGTVSTGVSGLSAGFLEDGESTELPSPAKAQSLKASQDEQQSAVHVSACRHSWSN